MTSMVRHLLEHVPVEDLEPGDAILTNDIYIGAGHLPDAFTISPVFEDDLLIGFAGSSVHLMDVGGASPGSQTVAGVVDNYQEGLRIPPTRHYRRGEPDRGVMGLIAENVRFPEKVLGDIRAMYAANNFGARRIREFHARYGQGMMEACFDRIIDGSELRTREAISAVPDGRYTNELMLDDYGPETPPIKLCVAVTIEGSDITIDWTGTDPQVPAGMNSPREYSFAYSAFAVKALIAPDIPMNEGCLRPLTFLAPEGSFVNPRPPAPAGGRAVTAQRHVETVIGALADAVPERAVGASSQFCNTIAGGRRADGKPYLLWDLVIGGFAGRSSRDGTEGLVSVVNPKNLPVEVSERLGPVLVERLEFVTDSGGAGKFRGACGLRKDIRFLGAENRVTPLSDRNKFAPHGVFGGRPGACGEIVLNPDRDPQRLHPKAVHDVECGDVVRFQVSGAGGYGEPAARPPEAVREDVLDGYVSREAALEEYDVVIAGDGSVDAEATAARRKE